MSVTACSFQTYVLVHTNKLLRIMGIKIPERYKTTKNTVSLKIALKNSLLKLSIC